MFGGLAGFPKPSESVTDPFVAGHASSSVSTALGMARARTLQHEDYHVVALMGDGAMTGGLAYEAMNDAGESSEHDSGTEHFFPPFGAVFRGFCSLAGYGRDCFFHGRML